MYLFVFSSLFAMAIAQTCTTGAPTGPCLDGACDTDETCVPSGTDSECCPDAQVIAATTTTSSSTTCVDLTNPRTGVSDCPAMASYCNNAVYYDLMTQQCPRTCGRCGSSSTTTSSSGCVDQVNPRTGVSDCTRMASYCNNSAYYTLMTQQCPRTCGRCSGTGATSTTSSTSSSSSTCVDKVNPSTGVSDCARMASYCNNSAYYTLMTQQCPRTCGRCTVG